MASRWDSRVASLRFFFAPVLARAWRARNRSARSAALDAAFEGGGAAGESVGVGGSSCGGASSGAGADSISATGSAVALVLRFFAGGILVVVLGFVGWRLPAT